MKKNPKIFLDGGGWGFGFRVPLITVFCTKISDSEPEIYPIPHPGFENWFRTPTDSAPEKREKNWGAESVRVRNRFLGFGFGIGSGSESDPLEIEPDCKYHTFATRNTENL